MRTREEFVVALREGLNHLYDPDTLRRSPLIDLFGLASRVDASSALYRVLIEGVEALEPEADQPIGSDAWQIYESLFYRYVQQLSQQEIADQMGICSRHVRRKQRAALQTLADRLLEQFKLQMERECQATPDIRLLDPDLGVSIADGDLTWVKKLAPEPAADLERTLLGVIDLVRPLAERHNVSLECRLPDALPPLAAHPVVLRAAVLSVTSVAIAQASGGRVLVSAARSSHAGTIVIQSLKCLPGAWSLSVEDAANLEMAHELARLCGGELTVSSDDGGIVQATLVIPTMEQVPVLVIDDNEDMLQLLGRYSAGTRYRLAGMRDLDQALSVVETLCPQIIVLDVMMPKMDGWEVLGRLRQHPLTCHIPVVVCTILAHEKLALSLGASGFIHKPVTQDAFLATLDQQTQATDSRPG